MDEKFRRIQPYTFSRYAGGGNPPLLENLAGWELTRSEGHPFGRSKRFQGEDLGGPFLNSKVRLTSFDYPSHDFSENGKTNGTGVLMPAGTYRDLVLGTDQERAYTLTTDTTSNPDTPFVPDHIMIGSGAVAVSRTIPTNPVANAATFLGELREGLPTIPSKAILRSRDVRDLVKGVGGEHLNIQFGVLPLISDLKKFVEASKHQKEYLDALHKNSGKNTRRRYSFPDYQTSDTQVLEDVYPLDGLGVTGLVSRGRLVRTTTIKRSVWFSGCYTYHLPDPKTLGGKWSDIEKLWGASINANTLWQLTPWSWAIDWFSSTGAVIQNLSAFADDSLVLRFGYVMAHSVREVTETWTGATHSGNWVWRPISTSHTFVHETKQRTRANPYGFTLLPPDLSDKQKSILIALGMSRSIR